ncbi:MAG: hypothetical protein R3F37_09955 [Candidatus Competibacteraceae bacterium]
MGETGYAILLDETGKAIAHGRPEQLTESLQDMSDHPAFKAAGESEQRPFMTRMADESSPFRKKPVTAGR